MELLLHKNHVRVEHYYVIQDKKTKNIHYESSIFSLQDSVRRCEEYGNWIISPFYTTLEEAVDYYNKNCI